MKEQQKRDGDLADSLSEHPAEHKATVAPHSKGRLTVRETRIYFARNAGGFDIYNCPSPEANARRLVACWNACEGVSTTALEAACNAFPELVEGLRELIEGASNKDDHANCTPEDCMVARAKSLLSKVSP